MQNVDCTINEPDSIPTVCEERQSHDQDVVAVEPKKAKKTALGMAISGLVLTFFTPFPFLASILGAILTFVASVALRIGTLIPMAYSGEWYTVTLMLTLPIADFLIASGAILVPFYICVALLIAALSLSIIALVKKCKLGIAGIVMSVLSLVAVILIVAAVVATILILAACLFMIIMFA